MLDEQDFRRRAETSLESLKRRLIEAEGNDDYEVEEQNGVLSVNFEEPPGKFVITPNTPVRQIWISALATSFKLPWSENSQSFALERTGESLEPLVLRLIRDHLAS